VTEALFNPFFLTLTLEGVEEMEQPLPVEPPPLGVGLGVGDAVGLGVGDGVGDGFGVGLGVGVGVGDGFGVGDGVGDGFGVGDGVGSCDGVGDGNGDGVGDGLVDVVGVGVGEGVTPPVKFGLVLMVGTNSVPPTVTSPSPETTMSGSRSSVVRYSLLIHTAVSPDMRPRKSNAILGVPVLA